MRKMAKVNYPKRKPRLKAEDFGDIKEPERHSMYQVVLDNLKLANRATYLHRIIYIGEHTFLCCDDAKACMEGIITAANETYCIEKLTGFFLYYTNVFIHMVEGDEDNLNKHLGLLLDKKAEHIVFLGTVKLLIHVSHINQRFFEEWIFFSGVPPKLLEKLDIDADLSQSGRNIWNCIKKVYTLIGNYAEDKRNRSMVLSKMEPSHTMSFDIDTNSSSDFKTHHKSSLLFNSFSFLPSNTDASKEYKIFLPEYELLDFVIKTSFTMKLQDYYVLYGVVPMRDIYKDRVWPVPHDFIPYDVFEKPYDCMTEFPKEVRIKKSSFISDGTTLRGTSMTTGESVKSFGEDKKDEPIENK